ncbi:hypothetical protein GFL49_32875 [Rhizobium leguminosarum bv. viciae]|nr:hypothetical protein [Rhizobium leguminosarum bv. viciae]
MCRHSELEPAITAGALIETGPRPPLARPNGRVCPACGYKRSIAIAGRDVVRLSSGTRRRSGAGARVLDPHLLTQYQNNDGYGIP